MEKLLKEVLNEITPTKEEQEKETKIIEKIFSEIKKFKLEPILVGSLAKKTDLRSEKDIDIFIKFHKDVPRKELEQKAIEIGKKIFKKLKVRYEIDYAEHPYVIGSYKGYRVELVPCYDVLKPQSAVDRTPLHTSYIKEKVANNEILRNEIRLLKKFMKGINVYGAEAKIQGFSGYLTELLILYYGSFEKTLRNVANWKEQEVIDIEHHWKNSKDLKYFFSGATLIVVDPVDKDRNVAAAISKQKLSEFVFAARNFLQNPKKEFFFPKEKKPLKKEKILNIIRARGTKVAMLLFKHKRINPNVLYSQLRKTKKFIEKNLSENEFKIFRAYEWSDEKNSSCLIFEFSVWKLPNVEHHLGPKIFSNEKDQEKFLKKYKNAYIEGDRFVVDKERKFSNAIKLLDEICKKKDGFGKDLKNSKVKIFEDKKILSFKNRGFFIFLSEIFK